MNLRQIWVISKSGLQLFSYQTKFKDKLASPSNKVDNFLKAGGIFNALTYFNEFLLKEPAYSIIINDLLWVIHHHIVQNSNEINCLEYLVIAIARIDLSLPVKNHLNILKKFCKKIAMEFNFECGVFLETSTNLN